MSTQTGPRSEQTPGPSRSRRYGSGRLRRWPGPGSFLSWTRRAWSWAWSTDAGLRAVRATLVIPGLFALTDQVVGSRQMATFAAFGGFATLVMTSFGGTRRDKAVAHLGLALAGTALVVIGTLVSSFALLATLVTLPVAFLVLFAGAIGPNWASGAMGSLLAFVLPAVSAGTASTIPARLAGWWLASVAGTAAVLLLSPRPASGPAAARPVSRWPAAWPTSWNRLSPVSRTAAFATRPGPEIPSSGRRSPRLLSARPGWPLPIRRSPIWPSRSNGAAAWSTTCWASCPG